MFKTVFPLVSIMFVRFFGLFIVMPVLSVYAMTMQGANELLIGLTFAGYSLAQMLLVMPFGRLSDAIGRKTTIAIGLAIFAAGSLVCAYSTTIEMLLFGRILQGAGAISAVTSALVGDIVKEEQRTKAMAFVGMGIGMSTVVSMIVGPVLASMYDLSMLFVVTFVLVVVEMVILFVFVPSPAKVHYTFARKTTTRELLTHRPILTMSLINLFQKGLITMTFVIVPLLFVRTFGWEKGDLITLYVPAFIVAFFAMGISSMLADAKGKYKLVMAISLSLFALSYALFGLSASQTVAFIGVVLFFVGFNMLEPMMQSLITKYAKAHERGNVLGLFNGFGFLGGALGGVLGGVALIEGQMVWVVAGVIVASVALLYLGASMHNPARLKNLYIEAMSTDSGKLSALEAQGKIVEWYRNDTEGLYIIKYDTGHIDEERLRAAIL
ncbi:MAG: hypothetical protein KU37_11780 [Sulfuricurvum sp. PC08-66]|nr:MAG: hypothetical protein KU37_11780 [Sulfuricurvum sp. PC08-66]